MIGEKIKQLRKEKNMSISALATKTNVVTSYLRSIEKNNQSNLSIQFIEKISSVLGVSVNELIGEEDYQLEPLDEDWLQLVKDAMQSNVPKKEFESFLKQNE